MYSKDYKGIIIEDGKAIVKTITKSTDKFEYLENFIDHLKRISDEDLLSEIKSIIIKEKHFLSDFFPEYVESFKEQKVGDGLYYSWFEAKNIEPYKDTIEEAIQQEKEIGALSAEIQTVMVAHLKKDIVNDLKNRYARLTLNIDLPWWNEINSRENTVFLDHSTPGWCNLSFKKDDLSIIWKTNYGYGMGAYHYTVISVAGKKKLFATTHNGLHDSNYDDFGFIANEVNKYLKDPVFYRKELYKHNIKVLKELYQKELDFADLIEKETLPRLKEALVLENEILNNLPTEGEDLVGEAKIQQRKVEDLKEKIEKLGDYDTSNINDFEPSQKSYHRKRVRCELIKLEVNELIRKYKEEVDLFEPL